jgi:hypothetical protein
MAWLIIMGLVAVSVSGFAQPCDSGGAGFYLYDQMDVDNFAAFHPNCDRIDGDLRIGDQVENLRGLTQLKYIGGSLLINKNAKLVNLTGLDNLTEIAGDLALTSLDRLKNLRGLERVEKLGGGLYLDDLPELDNLLGLDGLDTISADLDLVDLTKATTMVALGRVQHIGGNVRIQNCDFQTLAGFNGIQTLYGEVNISFNPNLDSLKGAENLQEIKGDFILKGNSDLVLLGRPRTRMGIYQLERVGGDLIIEDNDALGSLLGLNDLNTIDERLRLWKNDGLRTIIDLVGLTHVGDEILVSECHSLKDLYGLHNLNRAYALNIIQNNALISLYGLHNILEVEDYWIIGSNPSMTVVSGGIEMGSIHRFLNVKYIGGSLLISQGNAFSLLGFYPLDSIGGGLSITGCHALGSLLDFFNLKRVGKTLNLDNNGEITDFNFPSLTYIGGLRIEDNPKLGSIYGLSNVERIGPDGVEFLDGNAFMQLQGMEKVQYIEGDFKAYKSNIRDFAGLSVLDSISGHFNIQENIRLRSFNGMNNLKSVGGNLWIINNPDLLYFSSLISLKKIDGFIDIAQNRFLTTLSGLDSIDPTTVTELRISANRELSQCAVESVCDYLFTSSPRTIAGNATGCATEMEVQEACNAVSTEDFERLEALEVVPNPIVSTLRLAHHEGPGMDFTISSTFHQEVSKGRIWPGDELDVSGLAPGVYFIRVSLGNHSKTFHFVKL